MTLPSRPMPTRSLAGLLALVAMLLFAGTATAQTNVFVNELHYDNTGADAGEAIEIAAPQGTDLTGWDVVLYNGNGGATYGTLPLTGAVGASRVTVVDSPGIQNGAPDGVALVDAGGTGRQFLSYQGVFTAVGGPADGMLSTDIGVSQDGSEATGLSLQLTGTGDSDDDFTWTGPRAGSFGALNAGQTFDGASGEDPDELPEAGSCDLSSTPTYEVQGPGDASPRAGQDVVVEGVVVGDFEGDTGSGDLGGVFIQDPQGDGLAETSDGLFVFVPNAPELEAGDTIRVAGRVVEFFGLTELTNVTGLTICAEGGAQPAATPLVLPADAAARERLEGMRIVAQDALSATETRNVDDFGEVLLAAGGPLFTPTEIAEPGPPAVQLAADNRNRSILLDDARDGTDREPIRYIAPGDTVRRGDTVTALEGVLSFGFGAYRIQPTGTVAFAERNPRPAAPDPGGDLQVGSFNVLNYFITFGGDDDRGAPNVAEFEQQQAKIVEAINGLGAEVVSLQEIQDTSDEAPPAGPDPDTAVERLVEALNTDAGSERWAAVPAPEPYGNTDEIRVALIYQLAAVEPVGASVAFPDPAFGNARVPMAQTFRGEHETFTVVANHLKSKSCGGATGPNADQGDGQSCFNADRVAQAQAELRFVGQLQQSSGDEDVLVTGDLNSYTREDPIDVMTGGGLVNVLERELAAQDRYSFVFDGAQGVLDHALATESLAEKVTGAGIWHLNSDEPDAFEYSGPEPFYSPDPYRSSDHDAGIVGIADERPAPSCLGREATIVGTAGDDRLEGTRGDDVILARGGDDRIDAGRGDDLVCAGRGDDRVEGGDGDDEIDAGRGDDRVEGGDGNDRIDGGRGDDRLDGGDGDDEVDGGRGDDRIDGGDGDDSLSGGRGDDRIDGGDGRDQLDGWPGD